MQHYLHKIYTKARQQEIRNIYTSDCQALFVHVKIMIHLFLVIKAYVPLKEVGVASSFVAVIVGFACCIVPDLLSVFHSCFILAGRPLNTGR